MPYFTDQLKRSIFLSTTPEKIISLVPSQTELLFYLGLGDKIAGITKFCIHPSDKVKQKVKIGGTKQINIQLIRELQPDLLIANKEENDRSQLEELMSFCPVWISDINSLYDAIEMIGSIGEMTGRHIEAKLLNDSISNTFNKLERKPLNLRAAYLIWRKPYMAAGKATFINDMLQYCGLTNAFDANRYPEINEAILINANPGVVLLSSEPYPFNEKHIGEIKTILPDTRVLLVDGEMFSWYGSRLLQAAVYFKELADLLSGYPPK